MGRVRTEQQSAAPRALATQRPLVPLLARGDLSLLPSTSQERAGRFPEPCARDKSSVCFKAVSSFRGGKAVGLTDERECTPENM